MSVRCIIGWASLLLISVGLGYALHAWLPPEPCWSVRGDFGEVAVAPDGSAVTAWRADPREARDDPSRQQFHLQSPLTVYDGRTGNLRETFFPAGEKFAAWTQSADRRYIAAVTDKRAVWVADLERAAEWQADVGDAPVRLIRMRFSPDSEHLAIMDHAKGIRLLETRTGKLLHGWPARFDTRFHVPDFCHDGDFFVWEDTGETRWEGNGELRVWNVRTDRLAGVLKRATCLAITADGTTLFAAQKEGDDANFTHVVVWDVVAGRPRGRIGRFSAGRMGLALSPDDRIAVLWTRWPDSRVGAIVPAKGEGRGHVEFWDAVACRLIGRTDIETTSQLGMFSPDGRHFLLAPLPKMMVFDPSTGRLRWSEGRDGWDRHVWSVFFTADSSAVGWWEADHGNVLRQADSGEVQHRLPHDPWGFAQPSDATQRNRLLLVRSRKHVPWVAAPSLWERILWTWLPGNRPVMPPPSPEAIRVIDTRNLSSLFVLVEPDVDRAVLSDDGGTVVAVHDSADGEQLLRCYDVPGRRPWLRIVGIPMAVGAIGVAMRYAVKRLRRWYVERVVSQSPGQAQLRPVEMAYGVVPYPEGVSSNGALVGTTPSR